MSRLINADKIKYRDMSDGRVAGGVWYTLLEDIQSQPTVDAVPVIRCKDCYAYNSKNLQCMMHLNDDTEWYDNDFCSRAEKEEEDEKIF